MKNPLQGRTKNNFVSYESQSLRKDSPSLKIVSCHLKNVLIFTAFLRYQVMALRYYTTITLFSPSRIRFSIFNEPSVSISSASAWTLEVWGES